MATDRNWLDEDKILIAIDRVKALCDIKMEGYHMVSMRSALRELGYGFDQIDNVIQYCADHGFDYCIDPMIKSKTREGEEYPIMEVCYWGPDQLKSRLRFIR